MISSSRDFLERLKDIRISDDETMVSFDVASLFTSIPNELALNILETVLERDSKIRELTKLSNPSLINLVRFCLETNFQFNGKIYRQKSGSPMGSPISGLLAEIVMQHLEEIAMRVIKPKLWVRYVDDTFVILKNSDVPNVHEYINTIVPSLKFTIETEKDFKLNFLDVLVTRSTNGTLETSIFRKDTNTDKVLHFDSLHPTIHKRSCVKTLYDRITTHCSTPESRKEEKCFLEKLFENNGYPRAFINSCTRNRRRDPPQVNSNKWVSLPYIRNVSEATARILKPFGFNIAHKPMQTIGRTLSNLKDRIQPLDKSGVVYSIPCANCEKSYVGETGKKLKSRLHEHFLAVKRADNNSQIWNHCSQLGHEFIFKNSKILISSNIKRERLIFEAFYSSELTINRHIDLDSHYISLHAFLKQNYRSRLFNPSVNLNF
jgi:hypothetical protein